MKISRKNILNSILLVVGMFLCYSVFFQETSTATAIEISAENNLIAIDFDGDFEVGEEELVFFTTEFESVFKKVNDANHYHFDSHPLPCGYVPPMASAICVVGRSPGENKKQSEIIRSGIQRKHFR